MLPFEQNNAEKSLISVSQRDQAPQQQSSFSDCRLPALPSILFAVWQGCRHLAEGLAGWDLHSTVQQCFHACKSTANKSHPNIP